jgi:hypothetical protein
VRLELANVRIAVDDQDDRLAGGSIRHGRTVSLAGAHARHILNSFVCQSRMFTRDGSNRV